MTKFDISNLFIPPPKKNTQVFVFPIDFVFLKSYIQKANNLKAIHNKDYSVVKTFRAARKRRSLSFKTFASE